MLNRCSWIRTGIGSLLLLFSVLPALAQTGQRLDERINGILRRPEFRHAHFGFEFFSLDSGKPLYTVNEAQFFVPGSTTKLLTEGTALHLLGANYRFHTRVYRSGPIADGTLNGDLILVAGGDPNLSSRIQPDGKLAFENEDHSYGGQDSHGLPGDPLLVLHELVQQIANKGIHKIAGRVLIDASLFPEGDRELGTGVVLSPIVINDNLIDVIVTPGPQENAPVSLSVAPRTAYVNIINKAVTGPAASRPDLNWSEETVNRDGSRSVTLTGSVPAGARPIMNAYPVPEPSRYAQTLLVEALHQHGIAVALSPRSDQADFKLLARDYTPDHLVAEHVSPPLSEEIKVTLKVSQNLHASMTPFLLGALLAHATSKVDQAGFDLENAFLTKAKLDLGSAAQGDGAGGSAHFTPDFMVQYLLYLRKQKDFSILYNALPVLGRDGTLAQIQVNSPAVGHVHAKTGTFSEYDALNRRLLVTGKGLAGYMDTKDGKQLVFALYINDVSVPLDPDATQRIVGQALGEIAAAAYDADNGPGSLKDFK